MALDERETRVTERLVQLNLKKLQSSESNGNADAADDDLLEVNAGGKIVDTQ